MAAASSRGRARSDWLCWAPARRSRSSRVADELVIGTVVGVDEHPGARAPSLLLTLDLGTYGTHDVVLQKDGYDTLKTMQTVPPPWYQRLPFEIFSDNLLPFQLTNRHDFSYQLQPSPTVPSTQGLRERANSLRSEAHAGP